jgi:mannose/fructose/N-acetylgalactosamine-specific phosphotransferase system component IIC
MLWHYTALCSAVEKPYFKYGFADVYYSKVHLYQQDYPKESSFYMGMGILGLVLPSAQLKLTEPMG